MISYTPIGIIHSPWKTPEGMPIQPRGAEKVPGLVEVFPEYRDGLRDLELFSRVILVYHFHKRKESRLTVIPFLDTTSRGVFATRAPARPNAIGISMVRLTGITDTTLSVEDVDILDGTPLLDIKPYIPKFDVYPHESSGWMKAEAHVVAQTRADQRFS